VSVVGNVASSEVINQLEAWYQAIKRLQLAEATTIKHEVMQAIDGMDQDRKVFLYYHLIDSRYHLLINQWDYAGAILKGLKAQVELKETDKLLRYYYYFFSGLYEFHTKQYIEAIHFYRLAESLLKDIPDDIEQAEFNYQLAVAYYEIDQHFVSMDHAEKALELYLQNDQYKNRVATTQMIVAANQLDLYQFASAEALYKNAIELASDVQDFFVKGMGYYNLGVCYDRQDKLDLARECFESALYVDLPKSQYQGVMVGTKYMLARVLFKQGILEEGMHWFEEAKALADEMKDASYQAKLSTIHSIYKERDEVEIDDGLRVLKEGKLWSDVFELAINAARHFQEKEDYSLAAKYFDEGLVAKDQIKAWKEDTAST
jgi:response regulator aspartate phosphatase C